MLSGKDGDQPHFKSKLHNVALQNQPKITKKTHAEAFPNRTHFLELAVYALSACQMLNRTTDSKIKQEAARGECSKRAAEKSPDKSFRTRFYHSKEISLGTSKLFNM